MSGTAQEGLILHDILPDLRHRPNFLLGNNRLDKQLARIRMDYNSLNGFLHRRGLFDHSSCDGCFCLNGSSIIQSSSHVLLLCPIYAGERKSMLSSIESTLLANPDSLLDLVPSSVTAVNFAVAEAIYSFISITMSCFLIRCYPSSVSTSAYTIYTTFLSVMLHNF